MANNDIFVAGGKKCTVAVYPKAAEGSPRMFENVRWWKVSYKRMLVLRGSDWTELFASDAWNRISIVEQ